METRKTFVRVKSPQHFEQVIAAYRKAGAQKHHQYFARLTYIRCDECNRLVSGDDDVIAKYTKGYTELILRNGSLVPAVDPVDYLLNAAGIELPKPKDRRTRITYKEYPDGSREITSIENCLTREECEKVAPGYLDKTPCYYLDGKDIVLCGNHEFRFRANSKVLHDNDQDNAQIDSDFWPAVMRLAGERFVACKKAAAEKAKPKIVEVVI